LLSRFFHPLSREYQVPTGWDEKKPSSYFHSWEEAFAKPSLLALFALALVRRSYPPQLGWHRFAALLDGHVDTLA